MGGGTLVGRTVRKEFSFGILEGKVAYAHRPNGEALLLRVVRNFLSGENGKLGNRNTSLEIESFVLACLFGVVLISLGIVIFRVALRSAVFCLFLFRYVSAFRYVSCRFATFRFRFDCLDF